MTGSVLQRDRILIRDLWKDEILVRDLRKDAILVTVLRKEGILIMARPTLQGRCARQHSAPRAGS